MGLDSHGVLGEAVAEPGEKKKQWAKWAPLTKMTLPPHFNYLDPGGLLPIFYVEVADHSLDLIQRLPNIYCMLVLGTGGTAANTIYKFPGFRGLRFLRESDK